MNPESDAPSTEPLHLTPVSVVVREYGPWPDAEKVGGVTYDGQHVWLATGKALIAVDAATGAVVRTLPVLADAGTAFDGKHLFQLVSGRIQKLDRDTGEVLASIPAPDHASGLAWAEGSLWVGSYRGREIHQLDPDSGQVLRRIVSDRFVTGVTWTNGELWHATLEDDRSELRRVDTQSGRVLERIAMPEGVVVSGLESDGADAFFCGAGPNPKVRLMRRPKR